MKRVLFLAISTVLAATATGAQAKSAHMKWMAGPPGLPAGSTFTVVSGNPGKAGPFVIRAKLPANYVVPPHHHPADEKVSVVSGGPLSYGMGDKVDPANAGTLDKGYHVNLGAGMNHWASTTAPTTIQVTAMGPFEIVYVDPKDDPRTK